MFLVGLLNWWYGRGWVAQVARVRDRLRGTIEFFSIPELLMTLFAPFRQISAAGVSGPIGLQLRAFMDKLLSRLIGSIVRSMTIIAGTILLVVQLVVESVILVGWYIVPALPVLGFIMFAIGWTPSWT